MVKDKLKEVENITYFTKGHRGLLYSGQWKGKEVVIKTERKDSEAVARIQNEIEYLKLLNPKKIGPSLLFYDTKNFSYFVYSYIEGEFFPNFLEHCTNKALIKKVIATVFLQCFRLDRLKIDKEEMHHPFKHILIDRKRKVWLIDFERCHKTRHPKNVTQFSSYMMSSFIKGLLLKKKIKVNEKKVIAAAQAYRETISKKNMEKIVGCIK